MKTLKRIIIGISVLFIVLSSILLFLVTSTPGLTLCIKLAGLLLPGSLHVEAAKGRLIDHLSFHSLTYDHGPVHIALFEGQLHWTLNITTTPAITLDHLRILHGVIQQQSFQDITLQGRLQTGEIGKKLVLQAKAQLISPLFGSWQTSGTFMPNRTELTSSLDINKGLFTTQYQAHALITDAQHAQLQITMAPGHYQWSEDHRIPFQAGKLQINLTPEGLESTGKISLNPHQTVSFKGALSQLSLHNLFQDHPLNAELQLTVDSFDEFNKALDQPLDTLQGKITIKLRATGTRHHPTLSGDALLTNGKLTVPQSGITYAPIECHLQTNHHQWQAKASIISEGRALEITGKGRFFPDITGEWMIHGEHILVMKNPEYTLYVSPQLVLDWHAPSLTMRGHILVPDAKLSPTSFSDTLALSDDVVFVHQNQAVANPFHLSTDLTIEMGHDVLLDVKGLHGYLDGAIDLSQRPNSAPSATGELTIRDGIYKAYGQDLTIEQGQLVFTGNLIENPRLHIRATRSFNASNSDANDSHQLLDFSAQNLALQNNVSISKQTKVGIEVSGHLNAHHISLFSIPTSLSQSDILSMLLLGKPASEASESGGQLLMAAISSMNLDRGTKGTQLLSQLKETLGIDLNLTNQSTNYHQNTMPTTDNTSVVIGKSLSKRLYLSYNIGLLQQDTNVLTLKYLLNQFFSIQVTASDTGNGLDVLYTHNKE